MGVHIINGFHVCKPHRMKIFLSENLFSPEYNADNRIYIKLIFRSYTPVMFFWFKIHCTYIFDLLCRLHKGWMKMLLVRIILTSTNNVLYVLWRHFVVSIITKRDFASLQNLCLVKRCRRHAHCTIQFTKFSIFANGNFYNSLIESI